MAALDRLDYLLALLLKWTLAEAFIVPTGAMAPTIYGAHAEVVCANCSTPYAVGLSEWLAVPTVRETVHAECPNCGQPREIGPRDRLVRGDRILVEKISAPRRGDLIVFEYPEDRRTNYIKRLVGMPGETVEIVAGDVFIDGRRLPQDPSLQPDRWLLVHDSTRVVRMPLPEGPRWQPSGRSSSWKFDNGQWVFNGVHAADDALVFSARLTDELAYNDEGSSSPGAPLVGDIKLVCDLKEFSGEGSFEFRWEFCNQKVRAKVSADGGVRMAVSEISSASEEAKADEDVTRGKLRRTLSATRQLGLAIRDGRAYLTADDEVVVSAKVGPQDVVRFKSRSQNLGRCHASPAAQGPSGGSGIDFKSRSQDLWALPDSPAADPFPGGSGIDSKKQTDPAEPCRLSIFASRCQATLSRIVLCKDIYYRCLSQMPGAEVEPAWGCMGKPLRLGAHEYFVLGDNSSRSKDSRFWGTVPADAVKGVARWTYWPPRRMHFFQ